MLLHTALIILSFATESIIMVTHVQRTCNYDRRQRVRGERQRHRIYQLTRAGLFPDRLPSQGVQPLDTPSMHRRSQLHPDVHTLQPMDRVNQRNGLVRKRRFLAPIPEQRPANPTRMFDSERARSLCPSTLVADTNGTRFPRTMYRAVCHHANGDNSCDFSFSRLAASYQNMLDVIAMETECAVVHHPIEVIVECCEQGVYRQRHEWVDWPVECACAIKRVRTVTPVRN